MAQYLHMVNLYVLTGSSKCYSGWTMSEHRSGEHFQAENFTIVMVSTHSRCAATRWLMRGACETFSPESLLA